MPFRLEWLWSDVLIWLLVVGGRRLEHLKYLASDPLLQRFAADQQTDVRQAAAIAQPRAEQQQEARRGQMAQAAAKGPLPDLKFIAVGGSKVDPALITQARLMGLPVYEGYGLSECASVVSLNTPKNDKPGSVGKILPHVKTRISEGEIQIKNPGFLGYVGEDAPEIFSTGDLGTIDEEGFLSVTGRKKNILITSYGRNVSPEWVESILLSQPAIAQAIVYGDAQPHLSALIVPSSAQADIQGAVNAANLRLPDYAQIKDFQVVPAFSLANDMITGTGRPRRDQILKNYAKEKSHELLQQAG